MERRKGDEEVEHVSVRYQGLEKTILDTLKIASRFCTSMKYCAWYSGFERMEAVKVGEHPEILDLLLPSKGLVSYILSCHPPDNLGHDLGLAYEGAMSSTTSFDITPLTYVFRQSFLHRYRDGIVLLADKVCRWYDSVKTISSRWLSHRAPAMGDKL